MKKIKYDVINSVTGKQEVYTGPFDTTEDANIWYNKYGKQLEEQGKKLIRVIL